MEQFWYRNDEIAYLIDMQYTLCKIECHETSYRLILHFLHQRYKVTIIEFTNLNFKFINEFEPRLKSVLNVIITPA